MKLIEERFDNRFLDVCVFVIVVIFKFFLGVYELVVEYFKFYDFYYVLIFVFVGYEFLGEEDDLFIVLYFGRIVRLVLIGEIYFGMVFLVDLECVYDFYIVFWREFVFDGRYFIEVENFFFF